MVFIPRQARKRVARAAFPHADEIQYPRKASAPKPERLEAAALDEALEMLFREESPEGVHEPPGPPNDAEVDKAFELAFESLNEGAFMESGFKPASVTSLDLDALLGASTADGGAMDGGAMDDGAFEAMIKDSGNAMTTPESVSSFGCLSADARSPLTNLTYASEDDQCGPVKGPDAKTLSRKATAEQLQPPTTETQTDSGAPQTPSPEKLAATVALLHKTYLQTCSQYNTLLHRFSQNERAKIELLQENKDLRILLKELLSERSPKPLAASPFFPPEPASPPIAALKATHMDCIMSAVLPPRPKKSTKTVRGVPLGRLKPQIPEIVPFIVPPLPPKSANLLTAIRELTPKAL